MNNTLYIFLFLDNSIIIISYFLVIFGLWLIFNKKILYIFKIKNISRFRIKQNKFKLTSSLLFTHINRLINTSNNTLIILNTTSVYKFFIKTILLFTLSNLILINQIKIHNSIIISLIISFIPYLKLRIKLIKTRINISYEAEGLITELINQYKINYFNMIEAIDKTIANLDDYSNSKNLLFRLSLAIKDYKSEDELKNALNDFIYSIDTEWVINLADCIYLSVSSGTNVVIPLQDILEDLKDIKNSIEDRKRKNNETFTILKYLAPSFYILSIFLSVKYFNISLKEFLYYQFKTSKGLKMFILILILSILNYSIMATQIKRKFDF